MKQHNTKIEDGKLKIIIGGEYGSGPDVEINIDLHEVFESMTYDEAKEFASVLPHDKVLQEAIDRLTGDSFVMGDTNPITFDVLCRLEKNVLSGYKWNVLDTLRKELKNRTSHEHLYWKLYHGEHAIDGVSARVWLSKNNIECNYTTGSADDLMAHIDDRLTEFANGVPDGGKANEN